MLTSLKPPDLMIYLSCSVNTLMKRINLRGRKMEKFVPKSYIQQLDLLYKRWIANYKQGEKLIISTEKLDYIGDFIDRKDLLDKIKRYI